MWLKKDNIRSFLIEKNDILTINAVIVRSSIESLPFTLNQDKLNQESSEMIVAATIDQNLTHRRLGHIGNSRLLDVSKNVRDINISKQKTSNRCPSCGLHKTKTANIPRGPHKPRSTIHIDLVGKKVISIDGHYLPLMISPEKYFVSQFQIVEVIH